MPACDLAGAGLATLTGGHSGAQVMTCPSSPATDLATGRTTWKVTGAVAGASDQRTRLLVVPR